MFRTLFFFFLIFLTAFGVVWFSNNPGEIIIRWQDYLIETSFFITGLVLILFCIALIALYRFWWGIRNLPNYITGKWYQKRNRRGYKLLTESMVAIGTGEYEEVEENAKKIGSLLNSPSLTMLLLAQAAQLKGDEKSAMVYFNAMLSNKDTSFLAIRGLIGQALKANKLDQAKDLALKATKLKPKARWTLNLLFNIQARQGDWDEARGTLKKAIRNKIIPPDTGNKWNAIVYFELANSLIKRNEARKSLRYALRANKLDQKNIAVLLFCVQILKEKGSLSHAKRLILNTWRINPHPDLVDPFTELFQNVEKLDTVKRVEFLCKRNPNHEESKIAVTRSYLEAELWAKARGSISLLATTKPTRRVCLLMAQLEEKQNRDSMSNRLWLERAANAEPDRIWLCSSCGNVFEFWSSICSKCGSVGSVLWSFPGPSNIKVVHEIGKKQPTLIEKNSRSS